MSTNHSNSGTRREPHVVIVGGGFGGLYAARALKGQPVRITLLDRHNYHLFQPLLYQVATAALSAGDIASPIRSILQRQRNVRVLMAEVTKIDLQKKLVHFYDRAMSYDYLVIATGATSSYFGNADWEPLAPSLKSIEDALEIRRRMLSAFEAAELEEDEQLRRELLTFVIVGGGPTGVELAGTFAEIARHTLKCDFRHIDPSRDARVILVQSNQRILPEYPTDLSASAERQLKQLGVEVVTGKRVTGIAADAVQLGDETIRARTALWTAGVTASPLAATLGVPLDKGGRVIVEADLSIPGHPEAFVIGDVASFAHLSEKEKAVGKTTPTPLPGIAPVAIQEGVMAAANIKRSITGEERQRFVYHDRGTMATIGRAAAVGIIGSKHLSGFFAWLAWLFIHLMFLIGWDNRFLVVFNWAWSFFTYQRSARLITGNTPHDQAVQHEQRTPGVPMAGAIIEHGNAHAASESSVSLNSHHHSGEPTPDGAASPDGTASSVSTESPDGAEVSASASTSEVRT